MANYSENVEGVTVWSVGTNMSGYMPESSTYYTLDYDSARRAFCEELEYSGDAWFECEDHDLADAASVAAEDANLTDGPQFVSIGDMSFWLIGNPPSYYGFEAETLEELEAEIEAASDTY